MKVTAEFVLMSNKLSKPLKEAVCLLEILFLKYNPIIKTDKTSKIQRDKELQNWVQELVRAREDGGAGVKVRDGPFYIRMVEWSCWYPRI